MNSTSCAIVPHVKLETSDFTCGTIAQEVEFIDFFPQSEVLYREGVRKLDEDI
jgi:hypothetical protein